MKKKLLAYILVATAITSLVGCSNTNKANPSAAKEQTSQTPITFVLDWTPNTNHTGLYVALEKGYFKDEGLQVTVVQPPEDGAEALVASNKAQFGVSFQDTMAPALVGDQALPITAVAALIQHNTSGIISRKGDGIHTPKGLEGKKYATWDAPIEKAMLKSVMETAQGDFSKVALIPSTVTDEVSALQSKSVDAIWIFYAWAGMAAEVAGLDYDYFAFKDIDPVFDYYTPVVISNTQFLKEEPEKAKAFLRALKKGYEDAIKDPKEASNILLEASPELNASIVEKSQEWLATQYKAEVQQWGYIDPTRWNSFYNWLNENKLLDVTIPENTGFTNEYLED